MSLPPFIHSLHRPFNQQLKACRWVCQFVNTRKKTIKSASLNLEFYIWLLSKLHAEYKVVSLNEYHGIPTKEYVEAITERYKNKTHKEIIQDTQNILKKERPQLIERQIYYIYKAASYYVNLSKDKFYLIDHRNNLTKDGQQLLSIRSSFFLYSQQEKDFFFKKIIQSDFLLFLSLCYFIRLSKKYNLKQHIIFQFEFLDKYYGIKHFNFTSSSLGNFNTVRTFWIDTLSIINETGLIRKRYRNIIESNPTFVEWDKDLQNKIERYEKEIFKYNIKYIQIKENMEYTYLKSLKQGKADLEFVNLYDIKKELRISYDSFQDFLSKYYEQEKGKKHIFFSNIVSSIDRRKRFIIRGIPVLKIKIK